MSIRLLAGREAIDLERDAGGLRVTLSTGDVLSADFVVLATGHWRASDPLAGADGYCPDPWPATGLQDAIFGGPSLGKPRRVVILGAYLNAIDAVLSLALRAGHFRGDARFTFETANDTHVTLISRTGQLPRVWGRMPPEEPDAWPSTSELDDLKAASAGYLQLEACFDLLATKLAASRSAGNPARPRRTMMRWLGALDGERLRLGSWRILRKDIAAVTQSRADWGRYEDTCECRWQVILFGALAQLSEHSHAMDAADQHHFDSVVRTAFFNHAMPMTIDSAVRLEAVMRCGWLDVVAAGRKYTIEPTSHVRDRFRLTWLNPDGSAQTLYASHVVNALGQIPDIRQHLRQLIQRALRNGLIQPALRRFRYPLPPGIFGCRILRF